MIVLGEEYESIDIDSLTQHMVVLGQTGSGKTGFLLSLTESLMNNEIPTILVDIKGDMANVMLTKHHPDHAFYVSTPGSSLVDPVNVLGDMARDPNVGASSILKMIGEDPDPMRSSAHAFLATAIYEIRLQCTL